MSIIGNVLEIMSPKFNDISAHVESMLFYSLVRSTRVSDGVLSVIDSNVNF